MNHEIREITSAKNWATPKVANFRLTGQSTRAFHNTPTSADKTLRP